jgi:hypothetical protein
MTLHTSAPAASDPPSRVRFIADAPPALVETFDAGHPVAIVGRDSSANGTKAWRGAVHQVYRAAQGLERHGVLLRHLLPVEPDELQALAQATAVPEDSKTLEGRPFTNSFYVHDLRAAGLLVVISVGTGTKIDADTLHQPATRHIAGLLQDAQPCLLYSSDVARLGRSQGAFGPIPATLEEVGRRLGHRGLSGPWVGDDAGNYNDTLGVPLQPYSPAVGVRMIDLAGASEREARAIAVRLARAKRARSPRALVDGRAWWPWELTPPPGFACAVLSDGPPTYRRRGNLLYLDSADFRPTAAEVAGELPVVWDADGNPVQGGGKVVERAADLWV